MEMQYYITNAAIIIISLVLAIAVIAILIKLLINTKKIISMLNKAKANQEDVVNEREYRSESSDVVD